MEILNPSWQHCTPRLWQQQAAQAVVRHLRSNLPPGVVRATMGSGKGTLIAALCGCCKLEKDEVVVVTTSSQKLVEDLHRVVWRTVKRVTGRYYGRRKEWNRDVLVACVPSVPALAALLQAKGKSVALWLADEVHRTERKTILDCHQQLKPRQAIGFTATPYLADETQSLSLWHRLIYDYGADQALLDHYVVPWRLVHYQGDGETTRDQACLGMVQEAQGPGIVNANTIADAEAFAKLCRDAGIPVEALHSKTKRAAVRRALHDLEYGPLKAIVHVAMLTEGIDWPFLRWGLLRRYVTSRVRFVQEIGRLLRSYPGKKEAVIYDPHDLFGIFKLDYEAVLGGKGMVIEDDVNLTMGINGQREYQGQVVSPLNPWVSYLRKLAIAFDALGLSDRMMEGRWRHDIITAKQQQAIQSLSREEVLNTAPDDHQLCLRRLCDDCKTLTRGNASDLISVLLALEHEKKWPQDQVVPAAIGTSDA